MLYTQISELLIKKMTRKKTMNLSGFLEGYELTDKAVGYFKSLLDFNVDINLPQRRIVDLGKIISRVIAGNHVIDLGIKGFRADLIANSIEMLKHEVSSLVSSYKHHTKVDPVEDFSDGGRWLAFS
jgi:hypothetical protein